MAMLKEQAVPGYRCHWQNLRRCIWLLMLLLLEPQTQATTIEGLLLNQPGSWPSYTRGKDNYQWVLSKRALQNGITYLGSHERLRVALNKLITGRNLTIATIGGSITAGAGCIDGPSWPTYLINYMQDQYGQHVRLSDGAVAGTMAGYMSVCLNVHVPKTADVVFVEYSINELPNPTPPFKNTYRRQYERLLRKLLNLPNKPAVILVHPFTWVSVQPGPYKHGNGTFWWSSERELDEFAHYYHLPTLSLKTCCWELLKRNTLGFWRNASRIQDWHNLGQRAFFFDLIHPDGLTGARVLAELSMHLLDQVITELKTEPVSSLDQAMVALSIPEPMIHDNWESVNDKCFIGQLFTSTVTYKQGFRWVNEGRGGRSKWGMVATQPGSVLQLTLDTRVSLPVGTSSKAVLKKHETQQVVVDLAFLRSYQHMGDAEFACVSGCRCQPKLMSGHSSHNTSQLHIISVAVSQHRQCVVQIKVLERSRSGEHKVKVAAVVVSEEADFNVLQGNGAATELVHDSISSSKANRFEVVRPG